MNAAAKYINQNRFFRGHIASVQISSMSFFHISLIIAVLISSLSVIYVTNMHRVTFSYVEAMENSNHKLELEWGILLLEQASLATPNRVERVALEKLGMVFIDSNITQITRDH